MYYVYAYLRSKDSKLAKSGTPYYIGKGTNRRAWTKLRGEIGKPKDPSKIVLLEQNLSEDDALSLEKEMIKLYGRQDLGTGILRNKTDGGEGLSNVSSITRQKMSKAAKARIRKPFSEEAKLNIGRAIAAATPCKPVITPAGKFESRFEAAKYHNISLRTLGNRLKQRPNEFYYSFIQN